MPSREYLLPLLVLAVLFLSGIAFAQLECSFVVDLSPPYLVPGTVSPPDGSIIDSMLVCIDYDVMDDLSGVDVSTIEVRGAIHNVRRGTVDSLFFTGTHDCRNYDTCDSVVVCVHALDQIPDLGCSCPPNHMIECFWFLIETCNSGPFVESVVPDDVILSCEDQIGIFYVLDTANTCSGEPYAIDPSSFLVRVQVSNGGIVYDETFTIADMGLSWDGVEQLAFDPALAGRLWEDGDTVTITLLEAENDGGCALEFTSSIRFVVDLTPPEISFRTPACETVITSSEFTFDYTLTDAIAGVDASTDSVRIIVTRDGSEVFTETVNHIGEYTVPFTMEDGDTVTLCITASDAVDDRYCPANAMEEVCCDFYISIGEPYAFIVEPVDVNRDGWIISACDCQPIIMGIYSSLGLDTASVIFFANDDTMGLDDARITYETYEDSLIMTFTPDGPAPCWDDCHHVVFGILEAFNDIGSPLVTPIIDTFIVDLLPPVYHSLTPLPDTTVTDETVTISAGSTDSCTYEICDEAYLDIIVNETDSSRVAGMTTVGGPFENGDVVRVCVSGCRDNPDYCDPNVMRTCWSFDVAIGDISAIIVEPLDVNGDGRVISNCECQPIIWAVSSDLPLLEDSIAVTVDGVVYTLADAELDFDGDTLIFTPSAPCWEDGDSIAFVINRLVDETFVSVSEVARGYVILDYSGPYYYTESPADSSTISSTSTGISVFARDSICDDAISYDSLTYTINGVPGVTIYDTLGGFIDGLSGGDTVIVTAYAHDLCADYCDPNYSEYTWVFFVEPTDVNATLLEPIDLNMDGRVISNCECQHIDWLISHTFPLDLSTLEVLVDGISYTWGDGELSFHGDTLRFTPAGPVPCWTDGDSIYFVIVSLADSLGAEIDDGAAGLVIIDYSPPVLISAFPTSSISRESTTIRLTVEDAICDTVVYDSLIVRVDGTIIITEYGVREVFVDGLEDGNIVDVCVLVRDDCADYCAPNDTVYCWTYEVRLGAPNAEVIEPIDLNDDGRVISTCECQPVIWELDYTYPLVVDSIRVRVDGTIYNWGAPELTLSPGHDTLFFTPDGPPCWESGDSIHFALIRLLDETGGDLDENVCGYVIIDLDPPYFTGATPVGAITDSDVTISITASDEICVTAVFDSLVISIDGIREGVYPGVSTVDLTGLEDGNTVEVCAYAHDDCADYCDPNYGEYCWSFDVLMGDPGAVVAEPIDINGDGRVITACECVDQRIVWELYHTYPLFLDSITVTVDGIDYSWGHHLLSISADHDSLYFNNGLDTALCWEHGDSIVFSLNTLVDTTGGAMAEPVSGWVLVDHEPPIFHSEFPADGERISEPSVTARILAEDEICGDAVYDSLHVTINGIHHITYTGVLEGLIDGLEDGDSVHICAFAHDDCADYCDPNYGEHCWHFTVALGDFLVRLIEPVDVNSDGRVISNCECQPIIWRLTHTYPVDRASIEVEVAGITYSWGDPELVLSADEDTLFFIPDGPPCWTHADSFHFGITSIRDSLGEEPPSFGAGWVVINLSGPVFSDMNPAPGAVVSDADIDISVIATDDICGTAVYDSMIVVGATLGRLGTFTSFDESITMIGGDEDITVYAYAHDDCADYCDPNYSDTSWTFLYRPGCDLVADAGADLVICYGDSIQLSASYTGGTAPFEYSWTPSDNLVDSDILDPWTRPLTETTIFTFRVEDTLGCIDTDVVTVRVSPLLVIDILPDQYPCPGDTVYPLATGIEGGIEPLEIVWISSRGDTIVDVENPAIVISDTIDQTWQVTVTDSIGCMAFAEINLILDCGQPVATVVIPEEGIYSACSDQMIIMTITDTFDIDEATIVFNTGVETIGIDDPRLEYDGIEYLYFFPEDGYYSEGSVTVVIEDAANINGIRIHEPISQQFYIDLTPPTASFLSPPGPMGFTQSTEPTLRFNLDDNMTGVDPSLITLDINGVVFDYSDITYETSSPNITFPTGDHGLNFSAGDSVHITLTACDSPTPPESLYCAPNCDVFEWYFFVYQEYECDAVPVPFTPDGANNRYVQFEYPGLTLYNSKIYIYNVRNVLVSELNIIGSSGAREQARWFGNDDSGNPQKQGLYLYVIEVDGEIVCNGTIVLAR